MSNHEKLSDIILIGPPRSGSSWISSVLSQSLNMKLIHEPDNERHNIVAWILKKNNPRFPSSTCINSSVQLRNLYDLSYSGCPFNQKNLLNRIFKQTIGFSELKVENTLKKYQLADNQDIFTLNRKEKIILKISLAIQRLHGFILRDKRLLIKSVHAIHGFDYFLGRTDLESLILLRHPAALVNSYLRMNLSDANRVLFSYYDIKQEDSFKIKKRLDEIDDPIVRASAQISYFYHIISFSKQLKNNQILFFEDFSKNALNEFEKLYQRLNLEWGEEIEQYITETNTEGSGFSINRKIECQADKWRNELNEEKIDKIREGYSMYQSKFYQDFLT